MSGCRGGIGLLRGGYALIFSLLLILALSTVALGTLTVGLRESMVAAALERSEAARVRSEAAAAREVNEWSTLRHADMAPGESRDLSASPGAWARVERLDPGLFLVRAEAMVPGPDLSTRAVSGILVRVLDPRALQASLPAAATVDGEAVLARGEVAALATCGEPDGTAIIAPALTVGPEASLFGAPAYSPGAPPTAPAPDPFAPPLVSRLADLDVLVSATSPRPADTGGVCTEDTRNWGATDPAHPCHSRLPLVHAPRSLTITAGEARGIVVVDGDLRVDGTRFHGVIIVRGTLVVDGGARVRGAIRAERLELRDGSIHRDACEIRDALSGPALDRAFRLPDRLWVPLF